MPPRLSLWLLIISLAIPTLAHAGDTNAEPGPGALPAPPSGQTSLQKINPIPAVDGGLQTPLDPAVGVAAAGIDSAGALPALPEAAIKPGQTAAGAVRPLAGAGEMDAELPAGDGQPSIVPIAAHQAVDPYFVGALARLGVPQDLAEKLSDYQASRHPGNQDKVYHSLGHSQDVPAVVAAILENQPDDVMTDRQRILLILAAVLHDIDPLRKPETPPRVSATLDYLETDPQSSALLAEFARRYGISRAQVQALIKTTDFDPDPVEQKKIQADFEARVRKAFPDKDQAWALEWGRKLSFADKSATYLGSAEASDRQVRNLANEFRRRTEAETGKPATNPTNESLLRGSRNFLKFLKDSPDYAILPTLLQRNLDRNYEHFQRIADPSVPIVAENAQARGPPVTADETIRRISKISSSSDRDLAGLKKAGYAVLAPGALMDAKAEQRVLDIVEKDWMRDGEPMYGQLPFNDPAQPLWGPRMAGVREQLDPVVNALKDRLNAVLQGEDIEVRDVQLRLATPEKPEKQGMHVDLGGYITATYALRGRGTVLYRAEDAQGREAPTHSWAIITNSEREAATGIPGTVHDTPITDRPRVLLIIRFARRGQNITEDRLQAVRDMGRARAQGVMRQLAARGQKAAPAPKPSLIGALKKTLFGE